MGVENMNVKKKPKNGWKVISEKCKFEESKTHEGED